MFSADTGKVEPAAAGEHKENIITGTLDNYKRLSNLEFIVEHLPNICFSEGVNDPNIKRFCLRHLYGRKGQSANDLEENLCFLVLYDTTKLNLDDDMRRKVWYEVIKKHTKKWADLLSLQRDAFCLKGHPLDLRLGAGGKVKVERLEDLEKLEGRTVVLLVDDSVVESNMEGYFSTMKRDREYITFKGRSRAAYHAKLSMTQDGTNVSFGDLMEPRHVRKQTLNPSNSAIDEKTSVPKVTVSQINPMEQCSKEQGSDFVELKMSSDTPIGEQPSAPKATVSQDDPMEEVSQEQGSDVVGLKMSSDSATGEQTMATKATVSQNDPMEEHYKEQASDDGKLEISSDSAMGEQMTAPKATVPQNAPMEECSKEQGSLGIKMSTDLPMGEQMIAPKATVSQDDPIEEGSKEQGSDVVGLEMSGNSATGEQTIVPAKNDLMGSKEQESDIMELKVSSDSGIGENVTAPDATVSQNDIKEESSEEQVLDKLCIGLEFLKEYLPLTSFSLERPKSDSKQFCLAHIFSRKGPKANELERRFIFLILYDPSKTDLNDDLRKRLWAEVVQKHAVDWTRLLTAEQKKGWDISECDSLICIDRKPVEFALGNTNKNSKSHVRLLPLEDVQKKEDCAVVLIVDDATVDAGMKGHFSTLKNGGGIVNFEGQSKDCYHARFSVVGDTVKVSFGDLLKPFEVAQKIQDPSVERLNTCKPRTFKGIATEPLQYLEGSVFDCRESGDEGNLLTPAHEFKLFTEAVKTGAFIQKFAKEVLKFACACLNSRKNGTIHFGIADENQELASRYELNPSQIVGVPVSDKTPYKDKLTNYINNYFDEENRDFARMCICKPEFIKVETSSACATVKYVIEVDIESSYEFTNGKTFMVALPYSSDRKKPKKQYEAFIRNGPQSSTLSDASLNSYTKNMERIDSKRKQEELEIPKKSKNMTWQLRNMLGEDCGRLNSTYKRILVLSAMDASILTPEFLEKASVISHIPWSFVIDLNAKDKSEPGLCQSMTDKTEFEIHDAQEFNSDKAKKSAIPTAWVFGNGSGKRRLPKSWAEWQVSDEAKGVHSLIEKASSEYPPNRTIILFVIKPGFSKIEVMIYHWFILHFQKNVVCYYIEDEQTEINWQEYIVKYNEYLDDHKFLSQGILGLPWDEFIEEIKNMTVECQSGIIKVPLNKDTLMSMHRGQFNDRSVLLMDSKECSHLQKLHREDNKKFIKIKRESEKLFYRGQEVSMENLWFTEYGAKQVIKRDILGDLELRFRNALSSDPDISQGVETIRLLHSRGSGGTTVGKHFLWTLFYRQPPYIARCCIVNNIKEETINTIYNFWNYKNSSRLPLVVLVDEQQDSDFQTLVKGLSEKMEIRGTGIILLRVEPCSNPETESRQDDWTKCVTMDFRLKEEEQIRFDQKYEEMRREFGKGFKDYEKTLISFMMMMHRTQGDRDHYAERIVKSALTDLNNDERELLKFLSLIQVSVIDHNYRYIYIAAFDPIMSSFHFRKARFKSDWTSSISMNAKMFLKFKDLPVSDDTYDQPERGVTVIFSEFAEAILTWAMTFEGKSIGDVALDLMNSAAFPSTEDAPRMNEPLRCLYFNMYLALQNKRKQPTVDEKRELFSRLITKTLNEDGAVSKDNLDKALRLMELGFEKMDRPVLAQQVARLSYIHGSQIDDEREAYFANAEMWVQKALAIRKDAYFYDTAGRIRLRKLRVLCPVHGRYQRHHKWYDTDECTKALDLCLESIKWFQEAQRAAQIRKILNTATYTGEMSAMLYFASILSNSVVFQDHLNSNPGAVGKYFCHPSWKPKRIPWSEEHDRTLKAFRGRYLHCLSKVDEVNFILKTENETENDLLERLDGQFQEFFVYSSRGQLPNDQARWTNNWMFIESLTAGSLLYNIFKPKRMIGKRSTSHILSDLSEIQKKIEENLDLDVHDERKVDDVFMLTVVKIASYSPYRKLSKPKEHAIKEFRETKLNTEALLKREERISGKFKNYCLLFCFMFQWPHRESRHQTDKNWFKRYNETLEKLRSMSMRLQSDHQKQGSDTGEEFCRRQGLRPQPRLCPVTTQFYLGKGHGLEMYVHHNELHYYIRPQKGQGIKWEHPYVERRLQQLSGERIDQKNIEYTTADQEILEIEVASQWKERCSLEPVTFYVGFSWKGPLAYGVKVKRQRSLQDHTDMESTSDTYEVPRDKSP